MKRQGFEDFLKKIVGFVDKNGASIFLMFPKGKKDRMEIQMDFSQPEFSLEVQIRDFFRKAIILISKYEISDVRSAYVEFFIHNRVTYEEIKENSLRIVLSLRFLINSPKVLIKLKKKFKKMERKSVTYPEKVCYPANIHDFGAALSK